MKTFKITLAIVSLLSAGFIAGFYTNRLLVQQKISRVANMRYADGLKASIFEKIHATPEQQVLLDPVVEKYAEKIAAVHEESRSRRRGLMDSMRHEIKDFISSEQLKQLENFCDRYYRYRQPNPPRFASDKAN
jgi:hypothetical protein